MTQSIKRYGGRRHGSLPVGYVLGPIGQVSECIHECELMPDEHFKTDADKESQRTSETDSGQLTDCPLSAHPVADGGHRTAPLWGRVHVR
jgi:hypothetical protein